MTSGVKISALLTSKPAAAWSDSDGFEIMQNGQTMGGTGSQLLAYANAGITSSAIAAALGASLVVLPSSGIIINGAAGTDRKLRFETGGVDIWNVTTDSTAQTGDRTGSNLLLAAFTNNGSFINVLGRGERGSGPLRNGGPQWGQFAPLTSTLNRATLNAGVVGDNISRNDTQPTTTLGTDPITTQSGSAIVTVAWTGASSVVTTDSYVNLAGAAAVGGLTLSGWYKVNSVPTADTITVDAGSNASSSATGGGSSVTLRPSFVVYNTNHTTTWKSGAVGFAIGHSFIQYANPEFYTTNASGAGRTSWLGEWSVNVSPNDTSGLNAWNMTSREIDVMNRGQNKGYYATRFITPNIVEGDQFVAFNVGEGAPGGGTFTHADFGFSINSIALNTRWYHAFAISPNSLVGVLQDSVASHGGVGHDDFGAYCGPLANNPFTSSNGTSTITVAAGTGFMAGLSLRANGQNVYIPGSYTVGGVSFGNASYAIANINSGAGTFEITGSGVAGSTTSGGGTGAALYFELDVPYAHTQIWGQWAHGIVTHAQSKFTDGLLISTQAGNGIGWSTTPGTAIINATSGGDIALTIPTGGRFTTTKGATITPAANTVGLAVSDFSATGADTSSMATISGTWNIGATVAGPALQISVTDTASASTSELIRGIVNGSNVVRIFKDGGATFAGSMTIGSAGVFTFGARSKITSTADGVLNAFAQNGTTYSAFNAGAISALTGTAIGAGANTQAWIKASSTANLGIYYGTGNPSFPAAKGSLYSKTDATTTTDRFWVNTDGSTTWANFTSSA